MLGLHLKFGQVENPAVQQEVELVTAELFEAYLACPTKCFLRSTGAVDNDNGVASWVAQRNASYRGTALEKLSAGCELARDALFQSEDTAVMIDVIRTVYDKKQRPVWVPLRFVPSNKVT